MQIKIKNRLYFLLLSLIVVIATVNAKDQKQITRYDNSEQLERWIVQFHTASSALNSSIEQSFSVQQATQTIHQIGGVIKQPLASIHAMAVELTAVQRAELAENPNVKLIEADPERFLQADTLPYGITMVQADQVSDSEAAKRKVCIIDTGYDSNHNDLSSGSNISGEVSNTLTESVNLGSWQTDDYGHGTHVAGTISALNNNDGIAGIAPNGHIQLHIVKVIDKLNYWSIWGSDLIDAVDRCRTAGANIINVSIAGTQFSEAERQAFKLAYDAGILIVAAAGNKGNDELFFPASYDTVISVGAVDQAQQPWASTQQNIQIELSAPGVKVNSTLPDNKYGQWDGTSVATPHVAGVAALIWSHYLDCNNKEIRGVLTETAQDLGPSGWDGAYGYGVVQAKKAFDLLEANRGCQGFFDQNTDNNHLIQTPMNTSVPLAFIPEGQNISSEHGSTVWDAENGTFIYTPETDYVGVDFFTYSKNSTSFSVRIEIGLLGNQFDYRFESDLMGKIDISPLNQGGIIATWNSRRSNYRNNKFQEYDQNLTPLHTETIVQSFNSHILESNVGVGPDDDFVIVFHHSNQHIYAQNFDANRNALGSYYTVSSSSEPKGNPQAIVLSDGSYVISWFNEITGLYYANLYEHNRTLIKEKITLFPAMNWAQYEAQLVPLTDSNFLAVGLVDGRISAQKFSSVGVAVGEPISISTEHSELISNIDRQIDVTMLSENHFAVVWASTSSQDRDGTGVFGRVMNLNGNAVSDEVLISQKTAGNQWNVSVSRLTNQRWFAVWQTPEDDSSGWDVVGREFDIEANPLGNEQLIPFDNEGDQIEPKVVTLLDGRVVVALQDGNAMELILPTLSAGNSDIFQGDDTDNRFNSYGGNDIFYGGAGNDIFYGGDGTIAYGDEGDDIFYSSYTAEGGVGDDTFYGGTIINAGSGFDRIYSDGNDGIIDGGKDFDVLRFNSRYEDYTIVNNGDGTYTITDNRAGTPDGVNTITNIEALEFTNNRVGLGVGSMSPVSWDHIVQVNLNTSQGLDFMQGDVEQLPAHGTVVWDSALSRYVYTPDEDFIGIDILHYQVEEKTYRIRFQVGLASAAKEVSTISENTSQLSSQILGTANDELLVQYHHPNNYAYFRRYNSQTDTIITETLFSSHSANLNDLSMAYHTENQQLITTWTYNSDVYFKRYTDNIHTHSEIVSNALGEQNDITAIFLANGYLAVAWDDEETNQIFANIYHSDGRLLIKEQPLFPHGQWMQAEVALLAHSDGSFTAAGLIDGFLTVQRLNERAERLGEPEVVSTKQLELTDEVDQIQLLSLSNRSYFIGWTSTADHDAEGRAVVAKLFHLDNGSESPDTVLSEYQDGDQQHLQVERLANGHFLAVWQSQTQHNEAKEWTIKAREFDQTLNAVKPEFRIIPDASLNQIHPSVTTLNDGRLAVGMSYNNEHHVHIVDLGESGTDIFQGGEEDNLIYSHSRNDILYGDAGNDTFKYGDKVYGEEGNDTFYNGLSQFGGEGNDTFYGGHLQDGGAGNDTLHEGKIMQGGSGVDDMIAGFGGSDIDGGSGFDTAYFQHNYADYVVRNNNDGTYTVIDMREVDAEVSQGTSHLNAVEVIEFADDRLLLNQHIPKVRQADHMIQIASGSQIAMPFIQGSIIRSPEHAGIYLDVMTGTYMLVADEDYIGTDNFIYSDSKGNDYFVRLEIDLLGNGSAVELSVARTSTRVMAKADAGYNFHRFNAAGSRAFDYDVNSVPLGHTFSNGNWNTVREAEFAVAPDNRVGLVINHNHNHIYYSTFNKEGGALAQNIMAHPTSDSVTRGGPNMIFLANNYQVITWNDFTNKRIRVTLFNDKGELLLREYPLIDEPSWIQQSSAIAPLPDGSFILVAIVNDELISQRFNHRGQPIGERHHIVDYVVEPIEADFQQIVVEPLGDRHYVIAWTSLEGEDGSGRSIMAKVMNYVSGEISDAFIVSDNTAGDQQAIRLTELANERWLAVWQSEHGETWDVMAREFDRSGNKLKQEFQLTVSSEGEQTLPDITMMNDGRLVASINESTNKVQLIMITIGTDGIDVLSGDPGPNVLYSHDGDDILYGTGDDTLYGGGGNDTFYGGNFADGGADNDTFYGGNVLVGGDGDDTFYGGLTIQAGAGDDNIYVQGDVTIDGGDDYDNVYFTGSVLDYEILDNGDGTFTIIDEREGSPDGRVVLTNVEAIEFNDDRRLMTILEVDVQDWDQLFQIDKNITTKLELLTGTVDQLPEQGSLIWDSELTAFSLTPAPDFVGIDHFTYEDKNGTNHKVRLEVGLPGNGHTVRESTTVHKQSINLALSDGSYMVVYKRNGNAYVSRYKADFSIIYQDRYLSFYAGTSTISAAITSDDELLTTWVTNSHVQVMRHNKDGGHIKAISISNQSPNSISNPQITVLASQRYVVAWDDLTSNHLTATIMDDNDQPVKQDFYLSPEPAFLQRQVALVATPDGTFISAGIIDDQIVTQRHNDQGKSIGVPITISQQPVDVLADQSQISMTMLDERKYVISWVATGAIDGDGYTVMARMMDLLDPVSESFIVSTNNAGDQQHIRQTQLANGHWLAIWNSHHEGKSQLMAREFNLQGDAIKEEFTVLMGYDESRQPTISTLADWRVVASFISGNYTYTTTITLGTDNADQLLGHDENNLFTSYDTQDYFYGSGGDDRFTQGAMAYGGEGNDYFKDTQTAHGDAGDDYFEGGVNQYGGMGDDYFVGGKNIFAGEGADTILIDPGNSTIDGGDDFDTVIFNGSILEYDIEQEGNAYTITDNREGSPDGISILTNIEAIEFSDDRRVLDVALMNKTTWEHIIQVRENIEIDIPFLAQNIAIDVLPLHGEIEWNLEQGHFIYTPDEDYVGIDHVEYLDSEDKRYRIQFEIGLMNNSVEIPLFSYANTSTGVYPRSGNELMTLQKFNDRYGYINYFDGQGQEFKPGYYTVNTAAAKTDSFDLTLFGHDDSHGVVWEAYGEVYIRLRYETIGSTGASNLAQKRTGNQVKPGVSTLANGYLVTSWVDEHENRNKARLLRASDNQWITDEFLLFPEDTWLQHAVRTLALADGSFMAVGIVNNQVVANRFNHLGERISEQMTISELPTEVLVEPQQLTLLALNERHYIVAWTTTGIGTDVVARIMNINGQALSSEFHLAENTANDQSGVRLTRLNNGNWVGVWQTFNGNDWDIKGREFTEDGTIVKAEFNVQLKTDNDQIAPEIATLETGRVVMTLSDDNRMKLINLSLGTAGTDMLAGDDSNNLLRSYDGQDTLLGYGGDDVIYSAHTAYGGTGNDIFYGGGTLHGEAGDDTFYGGEHIIAGSGSDNIYIGAGDTQVDGGEDYDVIYFTGNFGDYNIIDNGDGSFTIIDEREGSPDGSNTIIRVEVAQFADDRFDLRSEVAVIVWDHLVQTHQGLNQKINFLTIEHTLEQLPAHGELNWDPEINAYQYAPEADFYGIDQFSYWQDDQERQVKIEVGLLGNGAFTELSGTNQKDARLLDLGRDGYAHIWQQSNNIYYRRFSDQDVLSIASTYFANHNEQQIDRLNDDYIVMAYKRNSDIYHLYLNKNGGVIYNAIANTEAAGEQNDPDVVVLANGYYVVIWDNEETLQIKGSIYNNDGSLIKAEFSLFPEPSYLQQEGTLLAHTDGSFTIAAIIDNRVVTKRFSQHGNALTETLIHGDNGTDVLADEDKQIQLLGLTNRHYVVAWTTTVGGDNDGTSIFAQINDLSGDVVVEPSLIHENTVGDQRHVSLARLDNGHWLASWQSQAVDNDGWGTMGREFTLAGAAINSAFRMTYETLGDQQAPYLEVLDDGRVVASIRDGVKTKAYHLTLGTDGVDILMGNEQNNLMISHDGQDILYGSVGEDQLYNSVEAYGGVGNDSFYNIILAVGNEGDDSFYNSVNIIAGAGNDNLYINQGDSDIDGGEGFDVAFFSGNMADYTILNKGNGHFTIVDDRENSPEGSNLLSAVEAAEFNDERLALALPEPVLMPWDHLVQAQPGVDIPLEFIEGSFETLPEWGGLIWSLEYKTYVYQADSDYEGLDFLSYRDEDGELHRVRIEVGLTGHGHEQILFNHATYYANIDTKASGGYVTSRLVGSSVGYGLINDKHEYEANVNRLSGSTTHSYPRIDSHDDHFVMAWRSNNIIYVERYLNVGAAQGYLAANISGLVEKPDVAMLENNAYVVAWTNLETEQIKARIYSVDDQPLDDEFLLFPDALWKQSDITLEATADGGFIAAALVDGFVTVQRYNHLGERIGESVIVSSRTVESTGEEQQLQLLMQDPRHYWLAWTDTNGDDRDGYTLLGRQLELDGRLMSDEIQLNQHTMGDQQGVRLTKLVNNHWLAVWQSWEADGDGWGIQAREFDENGVAVKDEFNINVDQILGDQILPDVTTMVDGRVVVTFVQQYQVRQIYTRILTLNTNNIDILTADSNDNVIYAHGDNDIIYALDGDDIIYGSVKAYGGQGHDTFYGGQNLFGDENDDIFYGGSNIDGGAGEDLFYVQGDSLIEGGDGFDVAVFSGNINDYLIINNGNNRFTVSDNRDRSPDGTVNLVNVEAVEFSDDRQRLTPTVNHFVVWDHLLQTPTNTTLHFNFFSGPIDQLPAQGNLVFSAEFNEYIYTPNQDFQGMDQFSYVENNQAVNVKIEVGLPSNGNLSYSLTNSGYPHLVAREDGGYSYAMRGINRYFGVYSQTHNQLGEARNLLWYGRTDEHYDFDLAIDSKDKLSLAFKMNDIYLAMEDRWALWVDQNTGEQNDARVIVLANDYTVVAWDDEEANQIKAAIYRNDGSLVHDDIDLFPSGFFEQREVSIAPMPDGSFIATGIIDGKVQVQRVSHTGALIGREQTIYEGLLALTDELQQITMMSLGDRRYVISWTNVDRLYHSIVDFNIGITRSQQALSSSEFAQQYARFTPLENGHWLSVWQQQSQENGWQIYGREYDFHGNTIGDAFTLTKEWDGDQEQPDIVQLKDGRVVVGFTKNAALRIEVHSLATNNYDQIQGDNSGNLFVTYGGDDDISIGGGNDRVLAGPGDDRITLGAGTNIIDGGEGQDTLIFSGHFADYSIIDEGNNQWLITDLRSGTPDGINTVIDVEQLEFIDQQQGL